MKIYAASLADYNAGRLHGVWINLEGKGAAEVQAEVQAMLKASPVPGAEEWLVHDYEECPKDCQLGETSDIDGLLFQQRMLEEHGDAWAAYMGYRCAGDESEEDFRDSYQGCFESKEAWAADFLESTGTLESIPENLRYYFDMEAYARDAEYGGDISFVPGEDGVHAFTSL